MYIFIIEPSENSTIFQFTELGFEPMYCITLELEYKSNTSIQRISGFSLELRPQVLYKFRILDQKCFFHEFESILLHLDTNANQPLLNSIAYLLASTLKYVTIFTHEEK